MHVNIAVIYNFLEQDSNHFMVMEFVEGANLEDLVKKYSVLPSHFVVPVFVQALEGLHHAHKKNIFHRDIKPANLMLTPDGTVKLMDFGIAKIAGEQKMTQVNKIIGTIEYMAPELIQGQDASASSDIYAMGLTLYEVLTGQLPFENDTDYNMMQAILNKKVTPPDRASLSAANPAIPKALSDIVMKALEKKPVNRFADARSFQQALIKAFPQYTEINMAWLKPAVSKPTIAETRLQDSFAAMQTREETIAAKPSAVESLKKAYKENKKLVLGIALVLFFLIISFAIFKNNTGSSLAKTNTDSLQKKSDKSIDVSGNSSTEYIIPSQTNNTTPPPVEGGGSQITLPDEGIGGNDNLKDKKPVKKEPVKVKEEKKKAAPVVVQKEEEVVVIEKPQPKDIYISSTVEVELYLQDNLGDSPKRTDLPVTFTVRNPVVYNGVTIISRGTVARGVIRLGRIKTDIDINTTTATNGQQIKLKAQRGHGRRNDLTTERNYTAIILPGQSLKY
ncbi:MAG: serine/threonine-protein kinase [Ferruginibacter sp.]